MVAALTKGIETISQVASKNLKMIMGCVSPVSGKPL